MKKYIKILLIVLACAVMPFVYLCISALPFVFFLVIFMPEMNTYPYIEISNNEVQEIIPDKINLENIFASEIELEDIICFYEHDGIYFFAPKAYKWKKLSFAYYAIGEKENHLTVYPKDIPSDYVLGKNFYEGHILTQVYAKFITDEKTRNIGTLERCIVVQYDVLSGSEINRHTVGAKEEVVFIKDRYVYTMKIYDGKKNNNQSIAFFAALFSGEVIPLTAEIAYNCYESPALYIEYDDNFLYVYGAKFFAAKEEWSLIEKILLLN